MHSGISKLISLELKTRQKRFDDPYKILWSRVFFLSFFVLFSLAFFFATHSYLSSLNTLNAQCHLRVLSINQQIYTLKRPQYPGEGGESPLCENINENF